MTTRNLSQRRTHSLNGKEIENKDQKDNKLFQLSKKLNNPYILTIFNTTKKEDVYQCRICPKKPTIQFKNLKRHLIESEDHEVSIKKTDLEDHKQLVKILTEKKRVYNKGNVSNDDNEERSKNKKGYLKFVAECFNVKLSFQQIQRIGLILKEIYMENHIGFLISSSFSLDELSSLANTWGAYIREKLNADLELSKYSLCTDNSTISGTNISAIQLRYLKEVTKFEQNIEIKKLEIQNRVIGLKYLEESSNGQTLFNIVKTKLLDTSEQINNNLVGFAHDHASSLSGNGIGLLGHLKRSLNKKSLFNINDPCHSLNLSIYKALTCLDNNIIKFVKKIHSHFMYPQRKEFLFQIQKKEDFPELSLRKYVQTRWLSLGSSLKRLLKIWPSLIEYMNQPRVLSKKKEEKNLKKEFQEALNDDYFKLKLFFISEVIDKVNVTNIRFQKQNLEIDQLPLLMNKLIKEIAELFMKENMIPEDLSQLKSLEWKTNINYLREEDVLLNTLFLEFGEVKFLKIQELKDQNIKTNLIQTFREFLTSLLENLLEYFPIEDELIQSLNFLSLDLSKDDMKKSVHQFNKAFSIIPSEEEKLISEEINELMTQQINWIRKASNGSSLCLWNLIEQTFDQIDEFTSQVRHRFPTLSKIFRTVHAFAPSSANVEQCFSILKLLKSNIRNSLKEETLESLVLIHEEFKDGKSIETPDRLITLFDVMKKNLNETKSRSRSSQQEIEEVKICALSQQDLLANSEKVKEVNDINDEINSGAENKQEDDIDSISKKFEESLIMEIEDDFSIGIIQSKKKEKKTRPFESIQLASDELDYPEAFPLGKSIKLKKCSTEKNF